MITYNTAVKKGFVYLILTFCSFFLLTPAVFAGDGDGSGGGKGVPLQLSSSQPASGQQGVSLRPDIKLTFNKNVVNMSVKSNNMGCFSLVSSDGAIIPIKVTMGDDQINPEIKNDVTLKPTGDLQPGQTYVVKISSALKAKSGAVMVGPVEIKFTTEGAPVAEPAAPQDTPKAGGSTEAPGSSDKTAPADKDSSGDQQSQAATQTAPKTKDAPAVVDQQQPAGVINREANDYSSTSSSGSDNQKKDIGSGGIMAIVLLGVIAAAGITYGLKRKR